MLDLNILLLQGNKDQLEAMQGNTDFQEFQDVSESMLAQTYRLEDNLFVVEIPGGSALAGKSLTESRLGDALGMRVLSIVQGVEARPLPNPEDILQAGDKLVIQGSLESIDVLKGLEGLTFEETSTPTSFVDLESEEVGLVEAMLSPQTELAGKTLRQLRFRDKYDLTVLAIWREG